MRLKSLRALALSLTAVALLLAVSAAARQQGNAPQTKEATPPSPPVKAKVKSTKSAKPAKPAEAGPMSMHHDMSAMGKSSDKGPQSDGKYTTIVGEVMDPACFLEAGPKSIGPGHYQCAYDCARSGQTLAIYARDEDRIYFIAGELPGKNPNAPVLPYIHKKVDVSGTVYHRSDAWGIVITNVALHQDKPADAGGKGPSAPAGATGAPAGK
jgi:hypothetical protein